MRAVSSRVSWVPSTVGAAVLKPRRLGVQLRRPELRVNCAAEPGDDPRQGLNVLGARPEVHDAGAQKEAPRRPRSRRTPRRRARSARASSVFSSSSTIGGRLPRARSRGTYRNVVMLSAHVIASSSGCAATLSYIRRASAMSSPMIFVYPARPICRNASHTFSARKPREFCGPHS